MKLSGTAKEIHADAAGETFQHLQLHGVKLPIVRPTQEVGIAYQKKRERATIIMDISQVLGLRQKNKILYVKCFTGPPKNPTLGEFRSKLYRVYWVQVMSCFNTESPM